MPVVYHAARKIAEAAAHAGYAAAAADLAGVRHHLHHALNCLAGPNGTGFDAKEMNPCANAGSGAIADTSDASKKRDLQGVAGDLTAAIAETDLANAKAAATKAANMLKAAE